MITAYNHTMQKRKENTYVLQLKSIEVRKALKFEKTRNVMKFGA